MLTTPPLSLSLSPFLSFFFLFAPDYVSGVDVPRARLQIVKPNIERERNSEYLTRPNRADQLHHVYIVKKKKKNKTKKRVVLIDNCRDVLIGSRGARDKSESTLIGILLQNCSHCTYTSFLRINLVHLHEGYTLINVIIEILQTGTKTTLI